MNAARFLRKCFTDPPAAYRSAKLVLRSFYGIIYWKLWPEAALIWPLREGGKISLPPGHPFTFAFFPATDAYEPEVRGFFKKFIQPGMTVIDCGSNLGYFSVLAGRLVGPTGSVLSIEANPQAFKLVQRNLELNHFGKAIHCAITANPGEVELFMPAAGDTYSSLRTGKLVPRDQDLKSWKVPGRTLDEVIHSEGLTRLDMIKIDIEGGELDALISASESLQKFRPLAIIEYGTNTWPSFGATPERFLALMDQLRYDVYQFDPKAKAICPMRPDVWEQVYDNLVLMPRERAMALAS